MNSKQCGRWLIIVGALLIAGPLWADNHRLIFLFNGTTEANREGLNHVKKTVAEQKLPYDLKFTQNPKDIQPGKYAAVVVFNTGVAKSTDIDPKLAAFIAAYPAKSEIILLTFIKNSHSIAVTQVPASDDPPQVDVIAAATLWPSVLLGGANGFSRDQILAMHDHWFKQFVMLLQNR
jgi:hypothetical protein